MRGKAPHYIGGALPRRGQIHTIEQRTVCIEKMLRALQWIEDRILFVVHDVLGDVQWTLETKATIACVQRDGRGGNRIIVERRRNVALELLPTEGGGRGMCGRVVNMVGKKRDVIDEERRLTHSSRCMAERCAT